MKKRNLLAGILVGVMAMTALAGCGETTQSPQSSTSTTSSSSDLKQTVTSQLYQEKTAVVQEAHS